MLMLGVAFGVSCSLVVDFEECASDAECLEAHGPGSVCGADKICEGTGGADEGCELEADCVEGHGEGWTCAADQTCKPMLADPCERSEGPIDDENAFRIGVILQLSGTGAGFGLPMLESIILAQSDFNSIAGVNNRPIALVACDTQGRDDRALNGARHLVDTVGVQAIIGLNSSQVIDISRQVTVPAGVLLISPSATAATISGLQDNNLVWRTAPSDSVQGQALGQLVNHAIENVVEQPADEIKVALLVRQNDRYATGLNDALSLELPEDIVFGGNSRFTTRNYPNIGAGEPGDYVGVVSELAAEAVEPDVVIILGSAEAWEIAALLDSQMTDKQPLYFVGDAVKNLVEAQAAPASLQGRIWGTAPQNMGERDYEPYRLFRGRYSLEYDKDPDDFQFVANAFDAVYVLAFAAAAEGFTGAQMALGMSRLFDGSQVVMPRATDAQQAMQILSTGGNVTYHGASGALNFDDNGDPQASPIALWCFEDAAVPEKGVILDQDLDFHPRQCEPAM